MWTFLKQQPQFAPPLCSVCFLLPTSTPLLRLFPPCPLLAVGLFTHLLSLQHYPTLFSSPLYIPSMFTLVSLAGPCSAVPANICVVVNAAPYFQHFIILISLPNTSFIFLCPFVFLLSIFSPLLCPELATSRLRMKRNGRPESTEEEESIGKAQNGASRIKLDISTA